MKILKLSLLLCLGLFLSVGNLQAQAKKACAKAGVKTCTKSKTAQAESSNATTASLVVNQEPQTKKASCDVSKCKKGAKTAQAAAGNGTTNVVKVGQQTGTAAKKCDPKNCNPKNCDLTNCAPGCCKGQKAGKSASTEVIKTKVMAVKSSME